eukprot:613133-Rhodomonas_salina.1
MRPNSSSCATICAPRKTIRVRGQSLLVSGNSQSLVVFDTEVRVRVHQSPLSVSSSARRERARETLSGSHRIESCNSPTMSKSMLAFA